MEYSSCCIHSNHSHYKHEHDVDDEIRRHHFTPSHGYGDAPVNHPGYGPAMHHQPGYGAAPLHQPGYGGAMPHQPEYGGYMIAPPYQPGYDGSSPYQPYEGASLYQPGYGDAMPHHQPEYGAAPPHQHGYVSHGGGDYPPPEHGSYVYPLASGGHDNYCGHDHHHSSNTDCYSHPGSAPNVSNDENSTGSASDTFDKSTFKVYCKANTELNLSVENDRVILATANSCDDHQHWIKDDKYGEHVKDSEGFTGFALINKATGQALKHATGSGQPVQVGEFKPDECDECLIWSMSKDINKEGYKAIRMATNVHLNMDVYLGENPRIEDGNKIVFWEWNSGDNQIWKIGPHCKFLKLNFTIAQTNY